jgi:phosphatidyl-myo-inositol dimannoside synthase
VPAPALAAITLDPRGGGVAAVSRLVWHVMRERWGEQSRLTTLVDDRRHPPSLETSTPTRLRFGAQIVTAQLLNRCSWLFYSHLSLARVQCWVPRPFRRPYVVFLHDIEAWRPLSPSRHRALKAAVLRLANSRYTAERTMAAHPDVGDVIACPLALPPPEQADAAPPDPLPEIGPRAVLTVGRMASAERYKGHDELLDAWPRLAARVPAARLVLVGTGDDVPRLKQKAVRLGIASSVIFTGFVSRATLTALYRHAALFALPSRREGFGLVYLEAMAEGLPCIGSTHDAAGDVIDDGVTGILVDQGDTGALADRLAALLVDEPRRAAMGTAGHRRFEERFTYRHFADRLVPLVEASLEESAAGRLPAARSAN